MPSWRFSKLVSFLLTNEICYIDCKWYDQVVTQCISRVYCNKELYSDFVLKLTCSCLLCLLICAYNFVQLKLIHLFWLNFNLIFFTFIQNHNFIINVSGLLRQSSFLMPEIPLVPKLFKWNRSTCYWFM